MKNQHINLIHILLEYILINQYVLNDLISSLFFVLLFKLPQIDAKSPSYIYVDEIIHVDNFNQIYFTGSRQDNPLERQVYR